MVLEFDMFCKSFGLIKSQSSSKINSKPADSLIGVVKVTWHPLIFFSAREKITIAFSVNGSTRFRYLFSGIWWQFYYLCSLKKNIWVQLCFLTVLMLIIIWMTFFPQWCWIYLGLSCYIIAHVNVVLMFWKT